jgi:hypothetical protein
MQRISNYDGKQILFSRMTSKSSKEYFLNLNKTYNTIPIELSSWSWSLEEIIDPKTEWFQTVVSGEKLYNGLYRSICNTYGFYNKEKPISVKEIATQFEKFPKKDKLIIKKLQNKYCEKIPIIAITTNKKQFYIYDGFHAAIARILNKKQINLVFAYKKKYDCIFKRPNKII